MSRNGMQNMEFVPEERGFAGFKSKSVKVATTVKDKTVQGASSLKQSASQKDWSREKAALGTAGTATKGAAIKVGGAAKVGGAWLFNASKSGLSSATEGVKKMTAKK